jgi:GntR family transcriptional regulator
VTYYRAPVSEQFPHERTPWKAIAAELRDVIERGDMVGGERIGTGADVAAKYQVNPKTARKALVALVAEGIVKARRGRGYFASSAEAAVADVGDDALPRAQRDAFARIRIRRVASTR